MMQHSGDKVYVSPQKEANILLGVGGICSARDGQE